MKMTEQQVLDKLDIADWRHMSKDKIVGFISAIPDMNPEVAKAALAQFPEYVRFSTETLNACKDYISESMTKANDSQKIVLEAYSKVLNDISERLKDGALSEEEREQLSNMQIELLNAMNAKDSEFKAFIKDMVKQYVIPAAGVVVAVGGAIGIKFIRKN